MYSQSPCLTFVRLLAFFLILSSLQAGLVYKDEHGTSLPCSGVPLLMYSSTRIRESGLYVQSEILTILEDGTCLFKKTLDHSRNPKLPKEERKITLRNFGPYPLPEEIRRTLQDFFSDSVHWTLQSKNYIHGKDKDIWLGEISLQYRETRQAASLSTSEKDWPQLSGAGLEFLKVLEKIKIWMLKKNEGT